MRIPRFNHAVEVKDRRTSHGNFVLVLRRSAVGGSFDCGSEHQMGHGMAASGRVVEIESCSITAGRLCQRVCAVP